MLKGLEPDGHELTVRSLYYVSQTHAKGGDRKLTVTQWVQELLSLSCGGERRTLCHYIYYHEQISLTVIIGIGLRRGELLGLKSGLLYPARQELPARELMA